MSTTQPKPIIYQDKLKQRCASYFTVFPEGKWDHFRKSWARAHQVPAFKFDEVQRDMQKSGAIPMVIGGKAFEFMKKDMEKDILAKHKLDQKINVTPASPLPNPNVISPSPDYSFVKASSPAPVENINPKSSSQESENKAMANEINFKTLSKDDQDKVKRLFMKKPSISYEDAVAMSGIKIKKSAHQYFKTLAQNGRLKLEKEYKNQWAPNANSTPIVTSQAPTETPDLRSAFIGITRPQIYNSISMEGRSAETIKALKDVLPSALAEIINPKMKFQVVIYDLPDNSGKEIPQLEIRRVF